MNIRSKWSRLSVMLLAMMIGLMAAASSAFAESEIPKIGNALEMEFNIQELIFENKVKLSWEDGGQAKKVVDSKVGIAQNIKYRVNAGTDYTDYPNQVAPQRIDVLLQITDADPKKLKKVVADGKTLDFVIIEGMHFYWLKEKVLIKNNMAEVAGEFDLTFGSPTSTTPFSAKLIAVPSEEDIQSSLNLDIMQHVPGVSYTIGSSEDSLPQDWLDNIYWIKYSTEEGYNFEHVVAESDWSVQGNSVVITGPSALHDEIIYEIRAFGYEGSTVSYGFR